MNGLPRVCIFARAPVLGTVKQRLAQRLGAAGALAAHETLVNDTLVRLAPLEDVVCELWIAGEPNDTVRRWLIDHGLGCRQQQGEDLGARMHHALASSLALAERAVVVGTDCPGVDACYVRAALQRLRHADVVVGPAEDGGYGLIGSTRACRGGLASLFQGVPWGTSQVLATTRERVAGAGYRLAELAPIWDVDTYADWQRYLARAGRAR